MDHISYKDFAKLEIRIGTIMSVEPLRGSEKLLKMRVDFGNEERQILAGIALYVDDIDSLVGKQMPFITNLEPRKMMGELSEGMMLAADDNGAPVLLHPEEKISSGARVW